MNDHTVQISIPEELRPFVDMIRTRGAKFRNGQWDSLPASYSEAIEAIIRIAQQRENEVYARVQHNSGKTGTEAQAS